MSALEQATSYFEAERIESWLFVAVGLAAGVLSAWLWLRSPAWRGAAVPLVLVGLIQLVVGGSILVRTPKDLARVSDGLARDVPALVAVEVPRMERVMASFELYEWIEIALIAAGIALALLQPPGTFAFAAGTALLGQAALMLVADLVAMTRGAEYLAMLRGLGQ